MSAGIEEISGAVKIRSGSQPAGAGANLDRPGSSRNQFRQTGEIIAHLTCGGSVLLTGRDGGPAVLAAVADALAKGRTRVLQVRPPLDLPGFMGQVGRIGNASGDDDVERGFNALTILGPDCDGIVLLVEDAHLLPHPTLFYLQFVLRGGSPLQLAFAGCPEIADTLALEGFAGLRGCFSLQLTMPEPSPELAGSPSQGVQRSGFGRVITRVLARAAACAGLWNAPVRPGHPATARRAVLSSDALSNDLGSPSRASLEEQSL